MNDIVTPRWATRTENCKGRNSLKKIVHVNDGVLYYINIDSKGVLPALRPVVSRLSSQNMVVEIMKMMPLKSESMSVVF